MPFGVDDAIAAGLAVRQLLVSTGVFGRKKVHGVELSRELTQLASQLRSNPRRALCRIGGDLAHLARVPQRPSTVKHLRGLQAILQRAGRTPQEAMSAYQSARAAGGCAVWARGAGVAVVPTPPATVPAAPAAEPELTEAMALAMDPAMARVLDTYARLRAAGVV